MKLATIMRMVRPHRTRLALCIGLMLFETAAMLMLPWLGGTLASGVLGATADTVALELVLAAILAVLVVKAALRFARDAILGATVERVMADLRRRIYRQLQSLPLSFFHARQQGEILSVAHYDVGYLGSFISETLVSVLPQLVAVAGAIVLMAAIDPALALLVAVLLPAFVVAMRLVGRELRPLARQIRDAEASLTGRLSENITTISAIKSFTREGIERTVHASLTDGVRRLNTRYIRLEAAIGPAVQCISGGAVVALLWFASERVAAGDMTAGELVAFFLYAAVLTQPFSGLAGIWAHTQHALGALHRLDEVMDHPGERFGVGVTPDGLCGHLRYDGVVFAYPDRETTLKAVTLDIPAGQTLAITGENGAGKSTLLHLLMRFDTPRQGRIFLDGYDIADLELEALRRTIGIVPQSPVLLNATVRDNIAYGREGAREDEIIAAARRAQADAFIQMLPDGYDTEIGDNGVRLSGGQRQRVALARALLKDPLILVLDEPTAMFDPEGERAFIADAREAFCDRTVILITHRPASLALADRVVRLEDGRIADVTAPVAV